MKDDNNYVLRKQSKLSNVVERTLRLFPINAGKDSPVSVCIYAIAMNNVRSFDAKHRLRSDQHTPNCRLPLSQSSGTLHR